MNHSKHRPETVTAAAILLFVYGALTLTCHLSCGATTLANRGFALNRQLEVELPSLHIIRVTTLLSGLVLSIAAVLCGMGVLRVTPLARTAAKFVCTMGLVTTIIRGTYDVLVVQPACKPILARMALHHPRMGQMDPSFMAAETLFQVAFGLVLCVLILTFLNVRSARQHSPANFSLRILLVTIAKSSTNLILPIRQDAIRSPLGTRGSRVEISGGVPSSIRTDLKKDPRFQPTPPLQGNPRPCNERHLLSWKRDARPSRPH